MELAFFFYLKILRRAVESECLVDSEILSLNDESIALKYICRCFDGNSFLKWPRFFPFFSEGQWQVRAQLKKKKKKKL